MQLKNWERRMKLALSSSLPGLRPRSASEQLGGPPTGAKAIHHRVDEGEVRLVDQLEAVDVAAEDLRGGPAEHALGGAGPHAERAILVGLDERDGQGIEVLEHQAALLNRGARTGAGQVTIPGHDARWS